MRFTTFHQGGQDRLGLIDGDQVIDLNKAQPRQSSIGVKRGTSAHGQLAARAHHARARQDHLSGFELL